MEAEVIDLRHYSFLKHMFSAIKVPLNTALSSFHTNIPYILIFVFLFFISFKILSNFPFDLFFDAQSI